MAGRLGSGAVRDTWDIGDLDDVGSAGQNGRGHGSNGVCRSAGVSLHGKVAVVVGLFLLNLRPLLRLLSIAPPLDVESPDEKGQNQNESNSTNNTAGNGTNVGSALVPSVGRGAIHLYANGRRTRGARRQHLRAVLVIIAGRAGGSLVWALNATLEELAERVLDDG